MKWTNIAWRYKNALRVVGYTPLGPGDCDRPTDRPTDTPCSLEEVRDSDARLGDLFTELLFGFSEVWMH